MERNKQINKTKNRWIIIMVLVILFVVLGNTCLATTKDKTPTLVNKLNSILKKIKEYMVKLAGPAAAVSIATGVMIRKLSFGDEEKMIIGKRVIINAIFCYFIILLLDLIIKFIEALV
ncbi:MAG: hypothetical protein PHR25_00495 [Clostridia bacterium]|nr:hypothetical protein [Clostridia bacterium]MDD4375252.1 hypothetical protein [Clostridia bacterium]